MNLGERLKYARKAKDFGVNQLALKAGIDSSQISRLENGQSQNPKFNTIKDLANSLDIPLDYFNDKAENKNNFKLVSHIWEDITDEQLEEVLHFIDYIKYRDDKKADN